MTRIKQKKYKTKKKKEQKHYVVFVGRKTGVYDTWAETQIQVNKFSGAVYKSYYSRVKAAKAYADYQSLIKTKSTK